MLFSSTISVFALDGGVTSQTNEMFKDGIGVRSIPIEDVLGDRQIVNYLGSYIHKFTSSEIERNDIVKQCVYFALSFITAPGAFLLGVADTLVTNRTVDVVSIGGVYTKTYYCRKIIDPSTQNANIPVPYQYSWVTIFYSSSDLRNENVVYIYELNDGGPRLANN